MEDGIDSYENGAVFAIAAREAGPDEYHGLLFKVSTINGSYVYIYTYTSPGYQKGGIGTSDQDA